MENCLAVCPTYVLWQSGQVSLYTPDREYLSCAQSLCVCWLTCVVQNVILRSVFLKMFVMSAASLLLYVKLALFLCGVGSHEFIRVGSWGFVWFYWEGVIVEDVMYYV